MKHFLLSLLFANALFAQTPQLLKDIYLGSIGSTAGASTALGYDVYTGQYNVNRFPGIEYNGNIIFSANDPTNGPELWISKGSEDSTYLLKDISPGSTWTFPDYFFKYNNKVYFSTNQGEFWCTDGTESGTNYVASIRVKRVSTISGSNNLVIIDDSKLWITDGTAGGTSLISDIWPGATGPNISQLFKTTNGLIYFVANNGVNGQELWSTDGTFSGTNMIKDVRVGSASSNISIKEYCYGLLYFTANNGVNGIELWRSDGTDLGTFMVSDYTPGSSSSSFGKMVKLNQTEVAFYYSSLILKTDGTVIDTLANLGGVSNGFEHCFKASNHNLYLSGFKVGFPDDSIFFYRLDTLGQLSLIGDTTFHTSLDYERYKIIQENNGKLLFLVYPYLSTTPYGDLGFIDLQSNTFSILKNFVYTYPQGEYHPDFKLPYYDNKWFFGNGYYSDGNTVTQISNMIQPSFGSDNYYFKHFVFNNELHYIGSDPGSTGYEIWKTNGVNGGTALLKDIYVGSNSFMDTSGPTDEDSFYFIQTPDNVYFCANDGIHGSEIWNFPLNNVDIQNKNNSVETTCFPNPVRDILSIKLNAQSFETLNISVYDICGKEILSFAENVSQQGSLKLDVSSLANGVYFIQISGAKTNMQPMKFQKFSD